MVNAGLGFSNGILVPAIDNSSVAGVGEIKSRRLVNDLGKRMKLLNAAFSMAFGHKEHEGELAPSDGTSWGDPELPMAWDGRSGVVGQVAWTG